LILGTLDIIHLWGTLETLHSLWNFVDGLFSGALKVLTSLGTLSVFDFGETLEVSAILGNFVYSTIL